MTKTPIPKPERRSKAKKAEVLFKKHKGLIKEYYRFVPFDEPIMIFIRRTGKAEWHEKVTLGQYNFTHSNGEQRYIIIDRNQIEFKVGDKKFKGYICHEDHPFPLPEEPLLTTEMFDITIDKTLHDRKDWETKLTREKGKLIWTIAISIAIIIAAYAVFRMVVPAQETQIVTQAALDTVMNATKTMG